MFLQPVLSRTRTFWYIFSFRAFNHVGFGMLKLFVLLSTENYPVSKVYMLVYSLFYEQEVLHRFPLWSLQILFHFLAKFLFLFVILYRCRRLFFLHWGCIQHILFILVSNSFPTKTSPECICSLVRESFFVSM